MFSKLDCSQPLFFPYDRRDLALLAAANMTQSRTHINPEVHPLGTFEPNYKMAASDGERLILTIRKKNRECGQCISKFMMKKNGNILSDFPPTPSPTVCLFTSFPAALALTLLRTTNKKSISKLPSKFCCEKGMLINCQYIIILGYQQHEY